jgi:hypothetical protein
MITGALIYWGAAQMASGSKPECIASNGNIEPSLLTIVKLLFYYFQFDVSSLQQR